MAVSVTVNGSGSSSAATGVKATELSIKKNGGMVRVQCTLTGVTPLLFNAMPRDVLLNLGGFGEGKKAKTAEKPDAREWAASKLHTLPDGRPCVPPRMLYAAMINAGQFVRLDGKRQVSNAKATTLPGLMTISSLELPLFVPGKDESPEWEVDIQQGRNPNGGEAVCIVRPCFYRWEIRPEFLVDLKTFSMESARTTVEYAGRRMGLGDFRSQKKGTFGQYAITMWKIID